MVLDEVAKLITDNATEFVLQTSLFIIFMLSLYCTASMLPCGRYYYEPEGGYVGNPWVKFSLQYVYIYLGWLIHQLDLIEHHFFKFSKAWLLILKPINVLKRKKNYSSYQINNYSLINNNFLLLFYKKF